MTTLEKILLVLQKIKDVQDIELSGEPLKIGVNDLLQQKLSYTELFKIMDKLVIEEKVIKVIRKPEYLPWNHYIHYDTDEEEQVVSECFYSLGMAYDYYALETTEKFDSYFFKIKQKISGEDKGSALAFVIEYDADYQKLFLYDILKNRKYLLKRYNYSSDNDKIILYLLDNQDEIISKKDLEEILNKKIKKSIYEIPRDLGFIGILRELFFITSNYTLKFRSEITYNQVKGLLKQIYETLKIK